MFLIIFEIILLINFCKILFNERFNFQWIDPDVLKSELRIFELVSVPNLIWQMSTNLIPPDQIQNISITSFQLFAILFLQTIFVEFLKFTSPLPGGDRFCQFSTKIVLLCPPEFWTLNHYYWVPPSRILDLSITLQVMYFLFVLVYKVLKMVHEKAQKEKKVNI